MTTLMLQRGPKIEPPDVGECRAQNARRRTTGSCSDDRAATNVALCGLRGERLGVLQEFVNEFVEVHVG